MTNDPQSPPGGNGKTPKPNSVAPPIYVELGARKARLLRKLDKGEGRLMHEVADAMEEVEATLSDQADGRVLLPVVVVYGRKKKKTGKLPKLFGFKR